MTRRRTWPVVWILSIVGVVALCGTAFAYMFSQTAYENNRFVPATVSCRVDEVFDGDEKTGITVQNTGDIEAYLRVRFVSYWVDAAGEVVAKPAAMPSLSLADGWIRGANDTCYFCEPVAPNAYTAELLAAPLVLTAEDGCRQVVEVFAEAIQSRPAGAVSDSWRVTVDANGTITVVS